MMRAKYSRPRTLFEIARSMVTGKQPDVGREEILTQTDMDSAGLLTALLFFDVHLCIARIKFLDTATWRKWRPVGH